MKRDAISKIENRFNHFKIELSSSDICFNNTERVSIPIMKAFFEKIFLVIDGLHQDSNFD